MRRPLLFSATSACTTIRYHDGQRAAQGPPSFIYRFFALPTYTLPAALSAELEIRKSRFIAYAIPVADRDAAMDELRRLREEHAAATHVCWALLAGGQSGMSDDGEPSGTAGRPILEVLRHHDLDGVLAAVVRYYGGVKLGAGGLVRAYTDAIASALLNAPRIERIAQVSLTVEVSYADEAKVRRWIDAEGYALVDSAYGMLVKITVRLPANALDTAQLALVDMTQGKAGFP
ncbi:IMPACT family member YigZ [Paraburkholderia metrosideri]|uniref:IMPACT family member YigZ n=1 Tax=Paraburkholderia metrosideri TaxID=580937 RepID=A0ABN7HQL5_9BURK|nr:IMPACT family member YigZ [Paraburkholderia metrosideri]